MRNLWEFEIITLARNNVYFDFNKEQEKDLIRFKYLTA